MKLALPLLFCAVVIIAAGLPMGAQALNVNAGKYKSYIPLVVSEPAYISIKSVPSGARVKIGLQPINGVIDLNTGRTVGNTPITVALRSSDMTKFREYILLNMLLQKQGCNSLLPVFNFDTKGPKGGTIYKLEYNLACSG